jgi:hypothetical protein
MPLPSVVLYTMRPVRKGAVRSRVLLPAPSGQKDSTPSLLLWPLVQCSIWRLATVEFGHERDHEPDAPLYGAPLAQPRHAEVGGHILEFAPGKLRTPVTALV